MQTTAGCARGWPGIASDFTSTAALALVSSGSHLMECFGPQTSTLMEVGRGFDTMRV